MQTADRKPELETRSAIHYFRGLEQVASAAYLISVFSYVK